MAKLVQRPNRNGFYLAVPVPRKLRERLRKAVVYRKAGHTRQEALRRRAELLVAVENEFRRALREDVVSEVVELIDPSHAAFIDVLDQTLRERGYRNGTDHLHTDPKLGARTEAALSGATDYHDWVQRRTVEEQPSKATQKMWQERLTRLAAWYGSDFLTTMTKEEAVRWKNSRIQEVKSSSLITNINTFKSFWNWLLGNGQVQENIWLGLTRKLKTSGPQPHVEDAQLDEAKAKADELNDIGFWLQYFSGCRKGDHQGLRFSDIDMTENTIRFVNYTYKHINRNLKGRQKDERTIPIHPTLREKLVKMLPEVLENNEDRPIWPDEYNAEEESFGNKWAGRFTRRYGFSSHKLRSYVVTQLISSNVSPYMLHAVTRHTVPGMSQVVRAYVRPTMEQVKEVVCKLT